MFKIMIQLNKQELLTNKQMQENHNKNFQLQFIKVKYLYDYIINT